MTTSQEKWMIVTFLFVFYRWHVQFEWLPSRIKTRVHKIPLNPIMVSLLCIFPIFPYCFWLFVVSNKALTIKSCCNIIRSMQGVWFYFFFEFRLFEIFLTFSLCQLRYLEMKSHLSYNNRRHLLNLYCQVTQNMNYYSLSLPEKMEVDRDGNWKVKRIVLRKVADVLNF